MSDTTSASGRIDAERLAAAWTSTPVAALVLDPDGTVVAQNPAARAMVGHLIGEALSAVVPPADELRIRSLVEAIASHAPMTCELDVVDVDGAHRSSRLYLARLDADPHGSASEHDARLVAQIVDIGDCGAADRRLVQQRAFRSALLELSDLSHDTDDDADFYATLIRRATEVVPGAQGGSILVRTKGTDEYRFVAAVGYELTGLQRYSLREAELFRDVLNPAAAIVRDIEMGELDPERAEWLGTVGRIHEIVVNVSAPIASAGEPVAFISLDNFEDPDAFDETSVEMTTVLGRLIADLWRRRELEGALRKERESFRHQALHDELTGLANRRHLEDRIDEAVATRERHGHCFGLLFVDIDDFKRINDTHGHAVGDRVLVAVADRLRRATRSNDTVGRWGGDEFVVVALDPTSEGDVVVLTERILAEFRVPLDIDGRRIPARISVGAAWVADGSADREAVVRRADAALYEAKAAGKGVARIGVI